MKNIFRVINELVASKVIETYAIGGAIAANFFVEPFLTYDIDVFFPINVQSALISLEPIYEHLRQLGYHPKGEFIEIDGWNVQLLPAPDALIEEGIEKSQVFEVEGEQVRVFGPDYLIAIALKTGRAKDFARIGMFKDLELMDWPAVRDLIKRFGLESQWQKYQALKS